MLREMMAAWLLFGIAGLALAIYWCLMLFGPVRLHEDNMGIVIFEIVLYSCIFIFSIERIVTAIKNARRIK